MGEKKQKKSPAVVAPVFNEATEFKVCLVKSEFQYSQSVLKNQKK